MSNTVQVRSAFREVSREELGSLGVGGRHRRSALGLGGGGYLQNCTGFKLLPRDPRLDNLDKMGLQPFWLRVAEKIGVDAFLEMWREVDRADDVPRTDTGMLLLRCRPFKSWQRYQRDLHIKALAAKGASSLQIQAAMKEHYAISLSNDRISKIISKAA